MAVFGKQKNDWDPIFHGHVIDPAVFMILYVLIGIVITVLAILLAHYVFFWADKNASTLEQQVVFESFSFEGSDTRLLSSDKQIYRISGRWQEKESLEYICSRGDAITVFSKVMNSDKEGSFYSVKALYSANNCLLSFEEANHMHIYVTWPAMLVPAVLAIMWALFIAGSIKVGRNPSRYSKRVVRLFFKDGYIRY